MAVVLSSTWPRSRNMAEGWRSPAPRSVYPDPTRLTQFQHEDVIKIILLFAIIYGDPTYGPHSVDDSQNIAEAGIELFRLRVKVDGA